MIGNGASGWLASRLGIEHVMMLAWLFDVVGIDFACVN
jgi:hypothetical protein